MFIKFCEKCESVEKYCFFRKQENHEDVKIKKVLGFLELHYCSYMCNVGYLAERTGLHNKDLNYLIEKNLSCSTKDLIENLKLEYALHSLQNKDKIMDIAIQTGYRDIRVFQRAFARKFGNTPQDVRDILRKSKNQKETLHQLLVKLWKK